jgi:phosphatidylserine decarboxylase
MIYDRVAKTSVPEKVYKNRMMRFFYGTALGGLFVLLLRLPFISKIYGRTQKSKRSVKKIGPFIKEYGIDMSEYEKDHPCFNDFFIRKRLRVTFDGTGIHLIAPADSCLLALEIHSGTVMPIKGRLYDVAQFLQDGELARDFEGGRCLIFRLRPYDYHRFSYIDDGTVLARKKVKGVLDTVNLAASGKFTLFSNYREISLLRTENFGDVVYAEVGAMLVGKIVQTHGGETFSRGDEKGYFEFGGSTVVLLLKKDAVKLDGDIAAFSANGIETKVRLGEKIGEVNNTPSAS